MRIITLIIFILSTLTAFSQTVVRHLRVQSDSPYEIYVLVDSLTWIQHDLTYLEYDWGWEYSDEINFRARKGVELKTAFVTCSDTTYLTILGGANKTVLKGGVFALNGTDNIIGK